MSTTFHDYVLNAQLSQAAYGIFDVDMNSDIARYMQALTDTSLGMPGM